MPKVLIVVATIAEAELIIKTFQFLKKETDNFFTSAVHTNLSLLVTGVGMVPTAFELGKHLQASYDYLINIGIAGSFTKQLQIGEIVNVTTDIFSEMGAEDDEQFIPFKDLNLKGDNEFVNNNRISLPLINELKSVKGITVNTIHGNLKSIEKINALYHPDVETMEGAAFLMACSNANSKYIQLRAISNYVEKRDKSKWNIPLAISNLNEFVVSVIQQLV